MSKKPIIRFLDPSTKRYQDATVADVGDLEELKTLIKTNLVDAINSMVENGIPSSDINDMLDYLNGQLGKLQSGEWTLEQLQSLGIFMEEHLTQFELGIDAQKTLWDAEVQGLLDDATEDYNDRIALAESVIMDAKDQLAVSTQSLEDARESLNSMELNISGFDTKFDEINNSLETVVYENKFDLMTAEFIKNVAIEIETAEGIERSTVAQILSAVDGRVSIAEGYYQQTANELANRLTYEELKGELDQYQFDKYGDNLIRGTRNFDGWDLNGGILSPGTKYRQAHTVSLLSVSQTLDHYVEGLEVGQTYTASISMHYSGEGSPVSNFRTGGENYQIDSVYEDTREINGAIRLYTSFVATDTIQNVFFYVSGIPLGETVSVSNIKIEYGEKTTPWKPHFEDTFAELEVYDSKFIQQANSITSWLRKLAGDEEETMSQEALWQVTAEGLLGQAQTVREVQDGTIQSDTAELILNSNEFSTRVETTVSHGIGGINTDSRNRIVNSNYLFDFEQWNNVNSDFTLEVHDDVTFASISRTGILNNSPATMKSNMFKTHDKEKLMIGVDIFTPNKDSIDNDMVIRLDLFDISDIRVGYQDIRLSEMSGTLVNNVASRFNTKIEVDNSLVSKGQITLQLPKNGSIGFSQLLVQNSDININEWQPAPEDIRMIQLRMNTWIEQDAEEVAIGAIRQQIQEGKEHDTGAFSEMWAELRVNAEEIDLSVKKDGILQSINLSEEGVLIDAEKVNITGELIASLMTAEVVDITKGFRLMNGTLPILYADANGNVVMNIQKLTINSLSNILTDDGSSPASKKDLEDISLTPGPKGEDGIAIYLQGNTSFDYNSRGELGHVKATSMIASHNAVLKGVVYYEFFINGISKQNTTDSLYMYEAPQSYDDMPQVLEVKLRDGSSIGQVKASNGVTYVGVKEGGSSYTHTAYANLVKPVYEVGKNKAHINAMTIEPNLSRSISHVTDKFELGKVYTISFDIDTVDDSLVLIGEGDINALDIQVGVKEVSNPTVAVGKDSPQTNKDIWMKS